jgi:hypothetical protein
MSNLKNSMKKYILILTFILSILLYSCARSKKEKVPDDILSKDELVPVLIDIHLAEAGASFSRLESDSFEYYLRSYYYSIFDKYDITKDYFEKSMAYYLDNPGILKQVYERVNDSLSNLQIMQTE